MARHLAITYVRHFVTKENEAKQYIGWTNVPVIQPKNVSHELKPEIVMTSDLLRCRQTAHLLFPNHVIECSYRWRELNFGDFEGKTYEQLQTAKAYRRWLDDPFRYAPPNGETFAQFEARIEQAVSDAIYRSVSHVVVVTHGGVIRYILSKYAPDIRPFWEWHVPFGEGVTLYNTKERWKERKRCISLAAVHFKGSENG
ncbi:MULTISPECIES: histidine phosphatase family protein [Anoxybacillus]|uniref:histidine phosphatase family protein n=1 Tax=Anoxybacillus TaxID=150247 RepID=UPI000386E9D4|nr:MULTISPECIES: histidine phosphatase family protein [Anoxybacillus]EPZ38918.1 alpha-ribazole phosphatase [Anoxybacillus ayderensis]KHF30612.1 Alpha-ribazole phosphatase [Anoxybacillus sp. BCO1]NNU96656.1 histidine phosphatase family protein [Anoxybacillus sp. EFIL]